MAELELERYLEAVSEEAPCGENLEYDPLLQEIEKAAEGTPERVIGDSVLPAEEPDWRVVRRKALEALERTRDVQVAVYLTRALVHMTGLPGLQQGMALIRGLLERFWDCVYPQADEDDEYPVLRMNTLSTLLDREAFINPVRHIPLTASQVMGRISLIDIEHAKAGENEEEGPNLSQIEAAFMDTPQEELERFGQAIDSAVADLTAIATLTQNQVGAVNAPDFSPLQSLLKEIQGILHEQLQKRGVASVQDEQQEQPEDETGAGAQVAAQAVALHAINSREDVRRALEAIEDYFQRQEPSSPIPFLLKRVRRLLFMDFRQILQDLAPDGIAQADNIFGPDPEEGEGQ